MEQSVYSQLLEGYLRYDIKNCHHAEKLRSNVTGFHTHRENSVIPGHKFNDYKIDGITFVQKNKSPVHP